MGDLLNFSQNEIRVGVGRGQPIGLWKTPLMGSKYERALLCGFLYCM